MDEKLRNSIKRAEGQRTQWAESFRDPAKPIQANWGAILGMLGFLTGIVLVITQKNNAYLGMSVIGFGLAAMSLLLKGKAERKDWERIKADCLAIEIGRIFSEKGSGSWGFQILCEFYFRGQTYKVSPSYWITFPSEKSIMNFLEEKIGPDNKIWLYVNPKNPLQAEVQGDDIKDKLLH